MDKARLGIVAVLVAGGVAACGGSSGGKSQSDTTPPTVASTSPGTGSFIDVSAAISFTFSEAMNRQSVEGAVTISPAVACLWGWSSDSLTASCLHAAGLPHSTHYSVTVGTGASDAAGNGLSAPYSFTFDTAPPPDTTPPTMSAVAPVDGATGVAIDTAISITFSEPVNQATVTVGVTPNVDLGLPEWSPNSLTVTFAPPAPLAYSTGYTLTVNGADNAGNALAGTKSFTFTTAPPPEPPVVVSATPAAGSTAAPSTTNISLSFSQSMDRNSVETAFSILPALTCAWGWSTDSTLATCTHADFAFDTDYTMTLGTGAMNQSGTHLAATFTDSFHTELTPDTIKPVVCPSTGGVAPCPATSTTFPAAAATGIARATNIVVSFSEPMDKATAQTAFAITSPVGHNAGVFTWNAAGDEMTYNPDVDFDYGNNVSWTVSTAAKDLAGNTLAQAFTSSFLAIRTGTTILTSIAALDGYASAGALGGGVTELYSGYTSLEWRGFLSFDLGGLPSTLTSITSASLTAYQSSVSAADVYTVSGPLSAESVDYGTTLDIADFSTPVLTFPGKCGLPRLPPCPNPVDDYVTLSSDATIGSKTVNVAAKVIRDWNARATRGNRCQFRLRFRSLTTAASKYVAFYSADNATNKPQLTVSYEYP
jgi:hypothetical protein